jgi:hypothetical protein
MKLGKLYRVPAVGLDPLPRLSRDQRWRNHGALVAHRTELSLDAVPASAGLVAKS